MKKSKHLLVFVSLIVLVCFAVITLRENSAEKAKTPRQAEVLEQTPVNSGHPISQREGSFALRTPRVAASIQLTPSQVAGRVFSEEDLDVLASRMPPEKFAVYERMRSEFPNTDWTEVESAHMAFMNKRSQFPLNSNDEQREAYAAWIGETEPVSRALIELRAEAHGLSSNGMENGRGYYIDGFREGGPVYVVTSNVGGAETTGAKFVRWNPGLDPALGNTIHGGEFYVNINDHGTIFENPEFQLPNAGGSRILYKEINDGGGRDHMTHVAGTVAAWGYNSSLQGMAPRAWIRSLIYQYLRHVTTYGMATPGQQMSEINPRTGNPQLRSIIGNTSLAYQGINTHYSGMTASFDSVWRDYPYYVHCVCAGNEGSGFASMTAAWSTSKNAFVIGAANGISRNSNGQYVSGGSLASFSSKGPTYDGRIKPDFVGKGVSVTSTISETGAGVKSGTSMSSPNVAGSVTVLMDYVRQRLPQQYLRSSTYKALLATTSDDLGNPGPDYSYGWGATNVHAAAKIIRQQAENPSQRLIIEDSLSSSQTWTETYYSDGTKPIKVTIAWLDPAGAISEDGDRLPRLINDLDLRLIDPSGTERKPYVMPFTTGQGSTPAFDASLHGAHAVPGDNITDPLEQVYIAAPAAGAYTVRVTHKGSLLNHESQPFSLAVSGVITASGLAPSRQVQFVEAVTQNGLLSPGEEAVATISLVNYSSDDSNNVVGTLTTSDPDITLLADTVSYGTMTSGQRSSGNGNFRIRLAAGASPRIVNLTLTIMSTSPGGPWTHPITCTYVNDAAINGFVRDGFGNPVVGATVSWTGTRTGQTTSDANGSYAIAEVDGTYSVTASKPGYVNRSAVSLTVPPYVSRDLFVDYYDLAVSPTELSMQAPIGQTASTPITLTNTGTLPINWSIRADSYAFTTSDQPGGPAYVWNDITTIGTQVTGLGDDTNLGPFPLGFSMPFYGQNFSSIRVCSNGWLSFTSTMSGYTASTLPNSSRPENLIAPFMRDLDLRYEGTVHYQQVDDSTFVVQFTNVPRYGSNSSKKATFQVMLKSDGTILFYYQRTDDPTLGLVGIQNAAKNNGLTIAFDQEFLKPGLAVCIQSSSWLGITPISGTIAVGATKMVTLTANATGMEVGTYPANVFVNSNDAGDPAQAVKVWFNVVSNQPTITAWPTAGAIVYGQALSASTLSGGSATVLGSFAFSDPGALLPAGSHNAAVTFTPDDEVTYAAVTGSVTVEVAKATPVITAWPTASAVDHGQYLGATSLTGGSASVPGGFAFDDPAMFNGQDAFTFHVSDGKCTSDLATVSLTVGAPAGAPEPLAADAPAADLLPVTAGLALWMDASQLIGLADGQQVNTWSDISGLNNHAIRQSTSSAGYPKYIASGLNGKPVLRFNSATSNTGDYFRFTRISTIRTVFWVVKENAGLPDGRFLLGDQTTYHFHRSATPNGSLWHSTYTHENITTGTTKLMGQSVNGTTTSLPANQFQLISLVTTGNVQANQIAQDRTFHGSWQGDIAEILIYTRALTADEEQQVGSYLADKYALTTSYPPVNQPPVAHAQSVTVELGTPTAITLTGNDPDEDPLTFEIVSPPVFGMLTGTAPDLTYTPPALPAVGVHHVTVIFTPTDTANYHSVTGTVSVIVNGGGSPYQIWTAQYSDHYLSDPHGDNDGDGLSNFHEFAFGLNPTNGNSNNAIVAPFDKESRSFSYTRRADSGLIYTVCISTDLNQWEDLPSDQVTEIVAESVEPGAETVGVTLELQGEPESLFLRVKAQ